MNLSIILVINLIYMINSQSPNCKGDGTGTWEYVAKYLCTDGKIFKNNVITPRFGNETNDAILICCKVSNDAPTFTSQPQPTVPVATTCGKRNKNGLYGKKQSYNGTITQFGEFPWMGALIEINRPAGVTKIFKCGISLIHPQIALTAAHCVQSFKANELTAIFGEWDSTSSSESLSRANMEIDDIVIHEKFDMPTLFNNIALIFLSEEVSITHHINTVCLPEQNQTPSPNVGCITAGWGRREPGNPEILQSASLPILTNKKCENALRQTRVGPYYNLDKSFICTGERVGQGQCIGDGGAPLFCRRSDQEVQFGIVSFNMDCNAPTVYTNVPMFRNWINTKITEKGYTIEEE